MSSIDDLKTRLAQILDEQLEHYPDVKLSEADKVKLLSEWDDEVSKVQEILDSKELDVINIKRVTAEYQAIQEHYDGHCFYCHMDFLVAMRQKVLELHEAVLALKLKGYHCNRVRGELEESFKFKISHGLRSSLSS